MLRKKPKAKLDDGSIKEYVLHTYEGMPPEYPQDFEFIGSGIIYEWLGDIVVNNGKPPRYDFYVRK